MQRNDRHQLSRVALCSVNAVCSQLSVLALGPGQRLSKELQCRSTLSFLSVTLPLLSSRAPTNINLCAVTHGGNEITLQRYFEDSGIIHF